jgi:hypothetical protein
MKNLAGNKSADEVILEELYLANIPAVKVEGSVGEVPYTYVGKLGKWTFRRAWYYWIASVEDTEKGLPLGEALALHNKKHPVKDTTLGKVIRSGGHAGGPSPDEYGANPFDTEELNTQLESLGYKKEYSEFLKESYIHISVGEISGLCNEGKLSIERYVSFYHIDEQIGLTEFAKALNGSIT